MNESLLHEDQQVSGRCLEVTVTNWIPAREAVRQFVEAHPELGLRYSENMFNNFSRIHGPALMKGDVMRKPRGLRGPAIIDSTRFDEAAFDLVSRGKQRVGEAE